MKAHKVVISKIPDAGTSHGKDSPDHRDTCASCTTRFQCTLMESGYQYSSQLPVYHPRPLQRNDFLFRQGDPYEDIYIIRTGSLKLFHTSREGAEQVLNFHMRGDVLSLGDIETGRHNASAVALETTSLCRINLQRLLPVCSRNPGLYDSLFRIAAQEISREHTRMFLIGQKNAEVRLASFILDISNRNRLNGYSGDELQLSMSRHDIANYLCLADETVSRIFTRFSLEKIIQVEKRMVRITDRDRLLRRISQDSGNPAGAGDIVALRQPAMGQNLLYPNST